MLRWIMHVDMDAFFASVEQLDNPSLKGLPVIVGGLSGRGVVSTCSYEARKFGVHSAMPMHMAKRLCPQGIYIQGRMRRYKEISDALILGFKNLGIELNYSGERPKNLRYCMNISCGADVSYMGRKLIGSAQFRSRGYLLQHGSILYDLDFDLVEKIFKQKVEKNSITTLNEIVKNLSQDDLIQVLKAGFREKFEIS